MDAFVPDQLDGLENDADHVDYLLPAVGGECDLDFEEAEVGVGLGDATCDPLAPPMPPEERVDGAAAGLAQHVRGIIDGLALVCGGGYLGWVIARDGFQAELEGQRGLVADGVACDQHGLLVLEGVAFVIDKPSPADHCAEDVDSLFDQLANGG